MFDKNLVLDVVESVYSQNGIDFFNVKLDNNGHPIPETELIFGIDLAEGGIKGDYSTIIGMNRQGKLICQYRAKIEQPALVGKIQEIFDLGFRGLLMPEKNMGLAFIEAIKSDSFLRQYLFTMRQVEKQGRGEFTTVYGWHTNSNTKQKMITNYRYFLQFTSESLQGLSPAPFADKIKKIPIQVREAIKTEIEQYYYDEKGRANARPSYHDDLLIAHMIACQGLLERYIPDEIDPNFTLDI